MTPHQFLALAVAAINAEFTTTRAYAVDDVPATRPDSYVTVRAERLRVSGNPRTDGSKSFKGYRLATYAAAKTVENVDLLEQKVTEALEFVLLDPDANPPEFETSTSIDPDDGWYSSVTSWTFLD